VANDARHSATQPLGNANEEPARASCRPFGRSGTPLPTISCRAIGGRKRARNPGESGDEFRACDAGIPVIADGNFALAFGQARTVGGQDQRCTGEAGQLPTQ